MPDSAAGWGYVGNQSAPDNNFKLEDVSGDPCPRALYAHVGMPVSGESSRAMAKLIDGSKDLTVDLDFRYEANLGDYTGEGQSVVLSLTRSTTTLVNGIFAAISARRDGFVIVDRGNGDGDPSISGFFALISGATYHLRWVVPTMGGTSSLSAAGVGPLATKQMTKLVDGTGGQALEFVLGVANMPGAKDFTAHFDNVVVSQ